MSKFINDHEQRLKRRKKKRKKGDDKYREKIKRNEWMKERRQRKKTRLNK